MADRICPFISTANAISPCYANCQFYDEDKKCCSLALQKQGDYKRMKKQNTALKVVSIALAAIVMAGAVAGITHLVGENEKPKDDNVIENPIEPTGPAFTVEEEVTLTIGNDYKTSTVNNNLYVSVQPYGVELPVGITIVPQSGYSFTLYEVDDVTKPTSNKVVTSNVTTAYSITKKDVYGISISKTDGSKFNLATESKLVADYLTAYNSGSMNVGAFDLESITLTHGNDYNSSFVNATNRASIQPYGITIPAGVTITPKSGYLFGFYSISDVTNPLGAIMLSSGWISSYTTTTTGQYGIAIKKSDDSDFDFDVDSNYAKDYFNISVGEVEVLDVWTSTTTHYSNWEGKKAIFIGDSITAGSGTSAGNRYWEYLGEKLGLAEVVGYGVAGSCLSTTSNYGTGNSPIVNRWETIANANQDADLVFIFAGTNDYGHLTPMGTSADTTDVSFYGALNIILGGLKEKLPNAKFCYLTPIHRTGDTADKGAGYILEDYVDVIKEVCGKYSIPYIDGFEIPNFNPNDSSVKSAYFPDGLHPNAKGHAYMTNYIVTKVNDLNKA